MDNCYHLCDVRFLIIDSIKIDIANQKLDVIIEHLQLEEAN